MASKDPLTKEDIELGVRMDRVKGLNQRPLIDDKLLDRGVKFLPWVGKDYERGWPIHGGLGSRLKLLIVGESHYGVLDRPDATRYVVHGQVFPEGHPGGAILYFRKLAQLSSGLPDVDAFYPKPFLQSIAFYNYVRRSMPDGKTRPAKADFRDKDAHESLLAVLEGLAPELVLFTGIDMWKGIPEQKSANSPGLMKLGGAVLAKPPAATKLKHELKLWRATSGGLRALAFPVYHPSGPRFGPVEAWFDWMRAGVWEAAIALGKTTPSPRCGRPYGG